MGILMIIFGFGALLFFILSIEGSKRKGYPKKSWLRYDLKKVRRYSCLALVCLWGFCIFGGIGSIRYVDRGIINYLMY